jgi:hypothetical protein
MYERFEIVMKKLVMISIAVLIVLALLGCGSGEHDYAHENNDAHENSAQGVMTDNNERPFTPLVSLPPDELTFSSLEDFLLSYLAVKNGDLGRGDIDFQGEWGSAFSDVELSDIVDSVDFVSLRTLYLPIGIPEDFRLHRITVYNEIVSFQYLHENDMISEATIRNAISHRRFFSFTYSRWDMDHSFLVNAMLRQSFVAVGVNATEDDLINGRYFFDGRYGFDWVHERERFGMSVPAAGQFDFGLATFVDERGAIRFIYPAEMVRFLGIRTVDLTNESEIAALLAELELPVLP